MAKKQHKLIGEFKKVSFGEDIGSLGFVFPTSECNLDANGLVETFAGALLDCRLQVGNPSQPNLPNVAPETFECMATTKKVSIGTKAASITLSFPITSVDCNRVHRFACQAGTLFARRTGDADEVAEADAGDAKAGQDEE